MALSIANAGANGALNGFWGQHGGHNLREFCDTGIQYATLGFVNMSPENDYTEAGYPGINFSAHCWADSYLDKKGQPTKLLSHCNSLKEDIEYCRDRGVKVILAIGGDYNAKSNYKVSTTENGEYFADFLYNAFGPYSPSWKGPRPFDISPTEHVEVDGFDFDIEAKLDNKPYIAMIDRLRKLDQSLIITGSPQCHLADEWQHMKLMLQKAAFDALFIQFYNNPSCDYIPGNGGFGEKFNLDDWVDFMATTEKSRNAKLFVGLPVNGVTSGGNSAAGSGYVSPDEMQELVCKYRGTKNWGGISLWDLNLSAENVVGGKPFHEHVLDALRHGCGTEKPTTTEVKATSSPVWSNSTVTTQAPFVTSTVYTTLVRTITECPPQVVDCPLGTVKTEVVPLYTTVCPFTKTGTPAAETGMPFPETDEESSGNESVHRPVSKARITQTLATPSPHSTKHACAHGHCPGRFQAGSCHGRNCSAVAVPTDRWTTAVVSPPVVPTMPVQAGASTVTLGLAGVLIATALQLLAL
ncbi:hypothetical protein DCS_03214 [Drechmeria coniospora]|uniref:GH18 domain-containing protein n=1 Tax=Drechmeria coniospora TaxID=98403 RepID=A0A151GY84_DRECN|nr:hypothetical protein DCS_03214 [Drechmeria coniospora]KYK62069.1 hypothetical protein DCS_03214 [Drechmeria coniospora]